MTQRRVSWLIGGGVAALALVLLLTTVPVTRHPAESQPIALHAVSSDSGVPACATMRLEGELESQRTTPLVNLWGLTNVVVTIVAPSVAVGGEATCPEGFTINDGRAFLYTPECESPVLLDDESANEWPEPEFRCEGNGVSFTAVVIDPELNEMTSNNSDSRFELGSSGLVSADQWCLGTDFWVSHNVNGSADGSSLDQVDGDICVDLS
jgi:hypothetical protein